MTQKTKYGFKVTELNHGISNTTFSWYLVANRADEEESKHQNIRLPIGPKPSKISSQKVNLLPTELIKVF